MLTSQVAEDDRKLRRGTPRVGTRARACPRALPRCALFRSRGESGKLVFRACADATRKDAWKRVATTPVSAKTAGVGVGALAAKAPPRESGQERRICACCGPRPLLRRKLVDEHARIVVTGHSDGDVQKRRPRG